MPGIGLSGIYAQELTVGSQLPLSYIDPSKKITILEYWSFNCIACIRAFPELEHLQIKFKDEIDIVLVSQESKEKVDRFFNSHPKLRKPLLRCEYADSMVTKYPEYPLPFQVWVNSDKRIFAIVDVAELNEGTIRQAILGKYTGKHTIAKSKMYSSLVEVGSAIWNSPVLYYSYLARCSETISVGHNLIAPGQDRTVRISEDCASILELYKIAYAEKGKFNFYNDFNVELSVANPDLFRKPKNPSLYGTWKSNHAYSYDICVPEARSGEIFQMMKEDLYRSFRLEAKVIRGTCKVLELLSMPGPNKLLTNNSIGCKQVNVFNNKLFISLRNQPFDTLIAILRRNLPEMPVMFEDRSFYEDLGNIDIEMEVILEKEYYVNALRKALVPYNLKLYVYSSPIDILKITENSSMLR
jgi:hypothetical protein